MIQVWHISHHWLSIKSRKKIGKQLGKNLYVLIGELGEKDGRCVKVLSEIDISKPLIRSTKLKYNHCELGFNLSMKNCLHYVTIVVTLVITNGCVYREKQIYNIIV